MGTVSKMFIVLLKDISARLKVNIRVQDDQLHHLANLPNKEYIG